MGSECAQCVTIAQRPSLDFLYKQWIKGREWRATAVGGFLFKSVKVYSVSELPEPATQTKKHTHIKLTGQLEVT